MHIETARADSPLLVSDASWREAHAVLSELKPGLPTAALTDRRAELTAEGYSLLGLIRFKELVSVAGVQPLPDPETGRALRIHDFVTLSAHRSKGYGLDLLNLVEDHARAAGIQKIVLYSRLARADAHRFYETKGGYQRVGNVLVASSETFGPEDTKAVAVGRSPEGYSLLAVTRSSRLVATASVVRAPSLSRGYDLRADKLDLSHTGDDPEMWREVSDALKRAASEMQCSRLVLTVPTGEPGREENLVLRGGFQRYGAEFSKKLEEK